MRVLFVCKGNAGRSQMACAFFIRMSQNEAFSAGTGVDDREGTPLPEPVVRCMAELGYDLSGKVRTQLTPEMEREADRIVVLLEADKRKGIPDYLKNSPKAVFWEVEDGKGKDYGFHVRVRDTIQNLVEQLVRETG